MLANSLADVVAEEAAKRLLPDLNLERNAKKAERIGIGVAKRLALVQADIWAKRGAGDIYELEPLVVAEETRTRSDSFPLLVSTEPDCDSAHTQQFSDYLSLFQVGNECDESRHVSAEMQFCDKRGKGRDNSFCHHAKRGGRKHTGKKRKLEIAEGMVSILQYNVTTWSEHAKHYILTSDFDATLIPETHLEREKLVTAAKKKREHSHGQAQAVRRSALQTTAQVREFSHWSAHVGFPSRCL